MNRLFVRRHVNTFAILLFVALFGIMNYVKPTIIFNEDGTIREFGIGYKNKTVVPIWLATMILAFMSYFAILYYLAIPKLR